MMVVQAGDGHKHPTPIAGWSEVVEEADHQTVHDDCPVALITSMTTQARRKPH